MCDSTAPPDFIKISTRKKSKETLTPSKLPSWWENAIIEFESNNLPPYKPPLFKDNILKREVVDYLEERFSINIEFIGIRVTYGDDWCVRINNNIVFEIGRHRASNGHTVFEMTSDEFINKIEDIMESGTLTNIQ